MEEKTFFLDLLHFGTGTQAINYFVFCFFAILGVIQGVAAHYQRRDLMWLDINLGYALGAAMIVCGFGWFFTTDQEIFIPALAGGEFFALFVGAVILAVPTTRVVAFALARLRAFAPAPKPTREKEPTG
ncbi:MAG: hypothetical protein HY868_22075 [Chloroflexi bacterium]|nr:hypothetical protein [Chloroflexota bacterium]